VHRSAILPFLLRMSKDIKNLSLQFMIIGPQSFIFINVVKHHETRYSVNISVSENNIFVCVFVCIIFLKATKENEWYCL
jgi:hypothetical protein